ncbi:MAG: hypothetical protein KZQ81_13510, partial [Candidatus Thiodiazotropha sp. (ex Rostrolucina anterorostrata)]|nr:hypothetical protein [Candidatus Thiodiazotropha sp. (ex Rostrolucina anterorostrata)]
PPPKGSRPASINTETFNTIKMRKVPAISSTYRKQVSHKRKKQYERRPGAAAHADNYGPFLRH